MSKKNSLNSAFSSEPKSKNIKSLKYLIKYIKPYKYQVFLMIIALIFTSSSVLIIGRSLQYVIDSGLSQHNPAMLDRALIYLICTILVLAFSTAARYYLITLVGEKAIADIRRDIYHQILRLSPSFYESNKSGEILSRMTTDTTLLQTVIGTSLSMAMRNFLMLIGGVILLITTSPKLAGMMGLVIPLVILPIVFFGKKMRIYSKLSQDKVAEVSAHTEETITGIKTIQAYTHEDEEKIIFRNKLGEVIDTSLKRIKSRAFLISIVISLVFGSIGLILWVGGHQVLDGTLTPGELSSFIFLAVVAAGAFGALAETMGDLQKAAGATERLVEFLGIAPEIVSSKDAILLSNFTGAIKVEDLTFYYPSKKSKASLENISLTIAPNKVTAIVGESGAGKSTIFQLLLRFYDTERGKILLDGTDIKDIQLENLRLQFAYVSQDPLIFSTSAYENILYGNPKASYEEVINASKAAAALEFIEKLPNGFDTYLGEKGVRLSGGQKQRIAIARAFLKNPKVLLLDEATSSLDSKNEKLVQQALENIMQNRTTIIIAHRLSTVRNANTIYVLKEGKLVEHGTHDELITANGEYNRLVRIQLTNTE
ncbi:ABC efflux transporter permease/ATP-binding protein [Candidatus Jidaibacter acanthamoeba]|uniref:ABC efflux transporter permease/ATP-binding protein n=1 Tax=Candidatus Jidaibacter acanthamoebae TaxID=86105 RepID=A0A0C1MUV9_9RICK|nr:ABC transporter transmembrane domain-containing protein [Candidatus Jidaibacter acanthamoeba]KIE05892.1 ABC efflux transporter permease/ATP-binding protein [Candidatus Jidaibacter acanthamoeba]